MKTFVREHPFLLMLSFLLFLGMGAGAYGMSTVFREKATREEAVAEVPEGDEGVIAKVASHVLLPEGTPEVVRLHDTGALAASQEFFRSVKDGDIILVYANKIILYDPVTDRVIDIAYISSPDAE